MGTENDLLYGNVGKAMLRLTLPIASGMLINTFFNIVDAMWVGNESVLSFAAVNLSSFSIWIVLALSGIVSTGADSLIANKLGEASHNPEAAEDAVKIAQWSLVLAVILGFIEAAVIIVWGRELLNLTAGYEDNMQAVVDMGYSYLGMMALGFPIVCINECFSAIFRAYGDTSTPLKVMALGFVINILLDPFLIYGHFGLPRMGAFGAALASVISFLIACMAFLSLITKRDGKLLFTLPSTRPHNFNFGYLKKIIAIGSPTALGSMVFSFMYMSIAPVISSFGSEAMASLGVGHKMESFNYTICAGISIACITMVGQNLGAGFLKRAKESAWIALKWSLYINIAVTAAFLAIPEIFVSWFGSDPLMYEYAVSYLKIIALSQIAAGVSDICEGIFAGGGNTVVPMYISIPTSLLRIPVCYILVYVYHCGLASVWWTFTALSLLRGALVYVMFVQNKWIKKDLAERTEPAAAIA
ncbi:MATE family efflux transporter [bacterium]|nr:MATE family efflux transporter [bacterium]